MCESSEGSGETARMLRLVWALTDKRCHKHTNFVQVREQWRLWQDCMHTNSRLSIDWKKYAICTPILCMCESSSGSCKTAHTLRHVWALAERIFHMNAHLVYVWDQWRLWLDGTNAQARQSIDWWNMPYVRPFCACVRAVMALARLHEYLVSSEYLLKEYAVCTPILRMCERSKSSGKTAHTLRHVWALAERIYRMNAHLVYLREQWSLWLDGTNAQARQSIDWWNMPYVRPFCACVRAVKALERLHEY